MAQAIDPAVKAALAARIRFYRDLGLTDFYRRPVDPSLLAELSANPQQTADAVIDAQVKIPIQENETIPSRKPIPAPPPVKGAPGLDSETWESTELSKPTDRVAALRIIREDIGDCTRCALHKGRNKLVFADGSPEARLMFVGEGPGADEDAQGLPFVGRAGQLLNNMITAMGLSREDVYIANIIKCRPPSNRTPERDECETCSPFLMQQIKVISPKAIVALGAVAAKTLLAVNAPMSELRGNWYDFRGTKLAVTYHPAFLLRDPRQKKEAWKDLQMVMKELGLKAPEKPAE